VNLRLNLAESTSRDLTLGDLLATIDPDELRRLRLGYGSAAGLGALRDLAAEVSGVSADSVLTTQGTVLGLFLLAFELCGGGGEAVLQGPCFPPSRDALTACGAIVTEVAGRFDDGYRLDVDQVVAALSPHTRLVSIASPQNPSGVTTSMDSLTALLVAMKDVCPAARVGWLTVPDADGGALCCMRLCGDAFSPQAVERFWQVLPELELQPASGMWFGDGPDVFRLGFGYLPQEVLVEALGALSTAMDRALT
jgi:DNA-binding transcriptional MocR family regulator